MNRWERRAEKLKPKMKVHGSSVKLLRTIVSGKSKKHRKRHTR